MNTFLQDLRYGIRMLMKRPVFTVVAVLTLALGIGANTAIFSVVNAVLLRSLPYPHAERIIQLWEKSDEQKVYTGSVSPHNFTDWRNQSQSFEYVAAYRYAPFTLTGGDRPERLNGLMVSSDFLSVMGVQPLLGRDFLPEEDMPGRNRAVILSHGLWQRRFAGNRELIGQTLTLNNESYTVVAVMGQDFRFPRSVELWSPLGLDLSRANRGTKFLFTMGRLKPGVTVESARAEMETIARNLEQQYPENNTGIGINLVTLHKEIVGDVELGLWILLGAVLLVLLIACANVANLQLARAAARQKETAIRTALGASPWHLIKQFLTESLLLAFVGGGLGLLLAMWGIDLLATLGQNDIPRIREAGIDGRVLGFTALISLLTSLVFGFAPALQATRVNLNETLKEGDSHSIAGWRGPKASSLLVVAEMALSMVLLVGAGLLINSFLRLQNVDPGFKPENALTMMLSLPQAKYGEPHSQAAFFQQTLQRISTLEGVAEVGAVTDLPFSGSRSRSSFIIEGRSPENESVQWAADVRMVSPGYFSAMGIRLLRGRDLTDRDAKESPGAAVINQTMAERFWPGEDAIGKRIAMGSPEEIALYGKPFWREVVGIVGDIKHQRLDLANEPEMYFSYLQMPAPSMVLVVRGTDDSGKLIGAIRSAVQSVDPDQPVSRVMMMDERLAQSISNERLNTWLLAALAALALALAAVGIYGVMSYAVTRSTREIGIRMALGARASDVLRLIVGQGLKLTLLGVTIGAAGAWALTRFMSSLLYEVTATDPLTFAGVSALLVIVALTACYLPARRATRVDPMVALRYE
ncbi:MAG: ABC transporter permease [Blastocatellia bacterium]|nr:ABC transporter permease [Blastocatellia bacterium]